MLFILYFVSFRWVVRTILCIIQLGCSYLFHNCYLLGAFFIPYLLSFVLAAAPTYILEISLGQYMSSGVVGAWKAVPIFQGQFSPVTVITLCFRTLKIIISVKNRGCLKIKGVRKTCFWTLKNNYVGEKQGVSENKGCPKTQVICYFVIRTNFTAIFKECFFSINACV